jgi:DNA integrity scanning protein DisA with diadenylate cyclase activity
MKDPKAAILPPHTHLTMKGGTLIEHPKSSDECVITTVSCYPGKLFITIYYKRLCRTLEDVKFLCEEIAQEWEATNNYYNTLLEKVEDKLIY